MRYKLIIAYEGTCYCGWQVQPNGIPIQSKLEGALSLLLKESTRVIGAGRADAGVHALAQVAHFDSLQPIDLFRFLESLNRILPPDIRVKSIQPIDEQFHARFSAIGKEYHYHLWLERTSDPFLAHYRYQPRFPVDISLLNEAARLFVGTHVYATFTNMGGAAKTSIRTIQRLDIRPQEGGIRLEFEGNGFLYKMVRNITGTLLEIASGKRSLQEVTTLFSAKNRRMAGIAAPAHGLFLIRVLY